MKPPTTVAIEIEGSAQLVMKDTAIRGFDVGVRARGAKSVDITNFDYAGPGRAFDIESETASIKDSRTRTTPATMGKSTVGYTKPTGPALPAQCPDCRSIFRSRHYNAAVPIFIVKNNTESCPVCGGDRATLAEGTFNLAESAIKIITAETFSLNMLRAIGAIAKDYVDGSQELTEAIDRIEKVSADLGAALKAPGEKAASKWLVLALGILAAVGYFNDLHDFPRNAIDIGNAVYSTMKDVIVKEFQETEQKEGHPKSDGRIRIPDREVDRSGQPSDKDRNDAGEPPPETTSA